MSWVHNIDVGMRRSPNTDTLLVHWTCLLVAVFRRSTFNGNEIESCSGSPFSPSSFSVSIRFILLCKTDCTFFEFKSVYSGVTSARGVETLQSKDTQFAAVKLPKCLEEPYNTCDRSTNSSRMRNRCSSISRDGHSRTHDTREGSS